MQKCSLLALLVVLAGAPTGTASANVITDWDEIGVKTVQPVGVPPPINPGLTFGRYPVGVRGEILLQFLASDHGNSLRRY